MVAWLLYTNKTSTATSFHLKATVFAAVISDRFFSCPYLCAFAYRSPKYNKNFIPEFSELTLCLSVNWNQPQTMKWLLLSEDSQYSEAAVHVAALLSCITKDFHSCWQHNQLHNVTQMSCSSYSCLHKGFIQVLLNQCDIKPEKVNYQFKWL